MSPKQARLLGIGMIAGAAILGLLVAAMSFALYEFSSVLFAVVCLLSSLAFWFLVIEPMGRSITRDVVSHMHETDD